MKVLVINGPTINMLGIREKDIYGANTYEDLKLRINEYCKMHDIDVEIYQSNHEGDLVDKIQEAYFKKMDAIIINPGAYTHTSIAILDALRATSIPTLEVHLSDVNKREEYRKVSYVREYVKSVFMGKGIDSYIDALEYLRNIKWMYW